ncbi:Os12g0143750, partial [Oryza sativa Japonica Group]
GWNKIRRRRRKLTYHHPKTCIHQCHLATRRRSITPRHRSPTRRLRPTGELSKAIQGLREVTAAGAREEECAVCLQDFVAEEKLRMMPCSHTFHQRCIFDWLRLSCICPLCRRALPTQHYSRRMTTSLGARS